jgi:hypothetical protein
VQAVLQERTEKGKQQDARATAGATDKESGSWRAGKAMEIIACKGKGEKTKGTRRRRSNKNWFEQEGRKKIDDSHRVRRERIEAIGPHHRVMLLLVSSQLIKLQYHSPHSCQALRLLSQSG